MTTRSVSVQALSFSEDLFEEKLEGSKAASDQLASGIWRGKCIEDPGLNIVIVGELNILFEFIFEYNILAFQWGFQRLWM